MRFMLAVAGVLLGLANVATRAAEPPLIPSTPEAELFREVPEPWRAYLVAARNAERVADPLARCLAFPDLPGNEWPKGHTEAHCRHHFEVKRPTLEELEKMVAGGEMAALESLFDASLARHFDASAFSDDIHDTFNYLLTNRKHTQRIDHLTAGWLKQAPSSAYAQLARAAYFNGAAWKARGSKYAEKTSGQDMRRMSELAGQAIPFFEKALGINPKLMPAYTGLIDVAMLDSRTALEASTVRRAEEVDAACPEVANVRMRTLSPRWGGSYEEMLGYAAQLSRHVPRRPYLAVHLSRPYADRANRLVAADELTRDSLQISEVSLRIGSDEGALNDAAKIVRPVVGGQLGDIRRLGYLLQESRFREPDAWALSVIAGHALTYEAEWSLRYGLRAAAAEPENALVHFNIGTAYESLGRVPEAERAYLTAQERGLARLQTLRALANLHLFDGDWADGTRRLDGARRAKRYLDSLASEFPDALPTALLRFYYNAVVNNVFDEDGARALLGKLDRTDEWQAVQAEWLEYLLMQFVDAAAKPNAGQ